jgi:hypothetical protein
VLSTLFFEPIRRIERFGWRKMAENEKLASYYFLVRVGKRLGIKGILGELGEVPAVRF